MVFALAVTYFTAGIVNPFVSGFVGGSATGAFGAAINGGNSDAIWRGALVSGIQGGISSGILHPIGAAAAGSGNLALYGLHIVGHGLVGGAANEAMGGKFQDGFLSAAVSTAASDMGLNSFIGGNGLGGRAGRTIVAGLIGGTASEIGGGKFANGFYTAAFQHLFNEEVISPSSNESAPQKETSKGLIIIVGGVTDDSYNIGGHVAAAIEGDGVYSFGTDDADGSSLLKYLDHQSIGRVNFIYRIQVTDAQAQKFLEGFNSIRNQGYSIKLNRTCASAVSQGLVNIGAARTVTRFPAGIRAMFESGVVQNNGFNVNKAFLPKGTWVTNLPKDFSNELNKYD